MPKLQKSKAPELPRTHLGPRGFTNSLSSKDKDKVVGVHQGQYKDKEYEVLSIKYKQWLVTNIKIKSE